MSKVLWICGRPGSGKTTLLREIAKLRPGLACFDAEEVRKMYPQLGFSDLDRMAHSLVLVSLACTAAEWGRPAAVAAMTPSEKLRAYVRHEVQARGVDFHLIHMEGGSRPLWKGTTYEKPEDTDMVVWQQSKDAAPVAAQEFLPQPRRQLFIGRWQPFHDGHKHIISEALKDGPVAIGVRQTSINEDNPHDALQRVQVIRGWAGSRDVEVFICPDIDSIHVGRGVGYEIVRHDEVPGVSGTELREAGSCE